MNKLLTESERLCHLYHDRSDVICGKMQEAQERWNKLQESAHKRKTNLNRSYNLHRFLADYRELCNWFKGMKVVLIF